jgi:hypothetical protein
LKLNRRKFAKNSNHLIRCKFLIDAGFDGRSAGRRTSTNSKPYRGGAGNPVFTICAD